MIIKLIFIYIKIIITATTAATTENNDDFIVCGSIDAIECREGGANGYLSRQP